MKRRRSQLSLPSPPGAAPGARTTPSTSTGLSRTSKRASTAGLADHEQAERCFAEALEIYRARLPIDAALAAVELARIQLLQGKLERARETMKAMNSLLLPLEKNPLVGALLAQLSRIAFAGGQVSEQLLEHAARKIREERAPRERRARLGP